MIGPFTNYQKNEDHFLHLHFRMIWDLETQRQYTVESVVVASGGDIQRFNNDLDFSLTGYGSLLAAKC